MKSFWNNNHPLQYLANQIHQLIHEQGGTVQAPRKNPKLERARKMANAYYDLYNNGGGNKPSAVVSYFGSGVIRAFRDKWRNTSGLEMEIDEIMAKALIEAAREQGLPAPTDEEFPAIMELC